MADFIVHTQKDDPEIHFFYRVTADQPEDAFPHLEKEQAIDWGEHHVETLSLRNDRYRHELIAIFKS